MKEQRTMKIRGMKNYKATILEYRGKGYKLITYTDKMAELENENELVIIKR